MKAVIITGSARSDGDTQKLATALAAKTNWHTINLCDYTILPYDYIHANATDDYLPLMAKIIEDYDLFIFATPVYWYAMSGTLKTFFDRFTDLLTTEKDLGRKLRGKSMAVLTCSAGDNLGDNFWLPFIATANYLGMNYLAGAHGIAEADNKDLLAGFIANINKYTNPSGK